MMAVASSENRHLKKQKLGPPDVYPQDPKQKEDELDDISVKQGFTHRPNIQNEYASARNDQLPSSKQVASYFNAILKKKAESNQLPDTGKKKQQINVKDFWHVTHRSKGAIEAWFKDLAGSKPLTSLAKKVPIFPKREDMLLTLCEYSVPMLRAAWFIKMTSFYHESKVAESKKKRQQPDIFQDWTSTLTRFLKEQLTKIGEAYSGPTGSTATASTAGTPGISNMGGSTPTPTTPSSSPATQPPQSSPHHQGISGLGSSVGPGSCVQLSHFIRNWNYCIQLALFMYQEGLLDRQDFLEWIVDTVVRLRGIEQDGVLRVVLPLPLQYLDEITQSEYLSRKLGYYSAVKISQLCHDSGYVSPRSQSPHGLNSTVPNQDTNNAPATPANPNNAPAVPGTIPNANQPPGSTHPNPLNATFQELLSCNQHRPVLLALSCFIQAVTLDCPTAMVWNSPGECKNSSWLTGSPLDVLPCAPSDLPMPPRYNNQQVRARLRVMEDHIRQRSKAAENRWSLDKCAVNVQGSTINQVLSALDALDRHYFDRVENANSLDTLYVKIFGQAKKTSTENDGTNSGNTTTGNGSSNNSNSGTNSNQNTDDNTTGSANASTSSSSMGVAGGSSDEPIVRTLCEWAVSVRRSGEHRSLVVARLLEKRQNDSEAQEEGDGIGDGRIMSASTSFVFQNLLLKFLDTQAPIHDDNSLSPRSQEFRNLVLLFSELIRQDVFSHDAYMCTLISRGDLSSGDVDLKPKDTAFGEKKENITKGSVGPDSPKDVISGGLEDQQGNKTRTPSEGRQRTPRHLIYAQHFPLPSDEDYCHEINQRYVLLYGVGKARDEARHAVKKLTKEILKLLSKRFSIDITEGGKVKKSSKGEFNFETMLTRFSALSYFDQHTITNTVAIQVMEMLSGVGSGSSNYLPIHDHISFLMDLMEVALNIQGLLDLCTQIIKETVEIEAQLVERQCLAGVYCPQLTLIVVGVLRKYHCCLLVSPEQTTMVFDGLFKLVKLVTNQSDCTSTERVVLSHLYDLYTRCSFLKNKHHESFSIAYPKIKQTLHANVAPATGNGRWMAHFMEEYIKNPKLKIEQSIVKQLNEPANRYSFVCSAIIEACSTTSNEKLNDIAILCAELTACCNALSSEWLGVLKSLCCSSENAVGYVDVCTQVDLRDPITAPTIHASLSVFTAILIARHCFTLQDFLQHVGFQSFQAAWNNGEGNPEAEPGARLTCHLLLRILKNVESPQPSQYSAGSPQNAAASISQRSIRSSCDRHLLAAAHASCSMGLVLTVLKAMLIVSDAMSGQTKNINSSSISDILGTSDGSGSNDSDMMGKGAEKACLADFARYALRQICSQEWVKECCLKRPEELCSSDNLLEKILKPKQSQRLLHQICHPDSPESYPDASLDQRTVISNILEDLDEWTLRISWLYLHLMYEQLRGSTQDLNAWLDNVAQAAIGVFNLNNDLLEQQTTKQKVRKPQSIILVVPLISKLPKAVKGRVLKVAGQVLNSVNFGAYSGKQTVQQNNGAPAGTTAGGTVTTTVAMPQQQLQKKPQPNLGGLSGRGGIWPSPSYRPFLQLVLMCLDGQDDQLLELVESLKAQLMQSIILYKDCPDNVQEKSGAAEDGRCRQLMLEALRLRFALAGGLFDTIMTCYSNSITVEWAILLVQLINFGVIDLTNNSELFTTVLDMLAALVHSTLMIDSSSDAREENRRQYLYLVRKIKREVGDNNNVSLRLVRQLIPLPKLQSEVITLEPWGSITDTKGNRLQDFDKEKKHGLQAAEKQKINPWDMLEGHKNPAPLSWVWFAATRLERKPLKYEEAHRLMRFHCHNLTKPLSYYLTPPPLPPEDLEPIPDKQQPIPWQPGKEEVKAPLTPTSDQSPRGTTKSRGKSNAVRSRRRQPRQPPTSNMPPVQTNMGYGQGPNFNNPTQNQWTPGYPQPHQQPQQPQQPYYSQVSQQIPPSAGGPRFNPVPNYSHGRGAVRSHLVNKQLTGPSGMMGVQQSQSNYPNMSQMPINRQQSMIRTPIRPGIQGPQQGGMYSSSGTNPSSMNQGIPGQTQMYSVGGNSSQSGPNQGNMSQYALTQQNMALAQVLNQNPGVSTTSSVPGGPSMMNPGYQAGYQGNPNMMNMRQQPGYMGQGLSPGQMVQRSQYIQGSNNGMSMNMMGNNQVYRPSMAPMGGQNMGPGGPGMMRSHLMMSGSQGNPGGPGQTGSLMPHMQRPMGGVSQQPQQQPQPGQQSQQQSMMHSNSQSMAYPQPPPY